MTAEKVGQGRWVGSLKDTKGMARSSLSSIHDWALKAVLSPCRVSISSMIFVLFSQEH